jgi:hypothetical protein
MLIRLFPPPSTSPRQSLLVRPLTSNVFEVFVNHALNVRPQLTTVVTMFVLIVPGESVCLQYPFPLNLLSSYRL